MFYYYNAIILTQPRERFHPLPLTLWEEQVVPSKHLFSWLLSCLLQDKQTTQLPLTVPALAKTWKVLLDSPSGDNPNILQISTSTYLMCIPDLALHSWSKYGILWISDLHDRGVLN